MRVAKITSEWAEALWLGPKEHGGRSLSRTKASIICQARGNLEAIQLPY